jgi:outer membrane cobalamin receptor
MIRTLAAALVTGTCIAALASPAAAQTREYRIPAGSLKSALDAYARQSGQQVVYRADQVRSARSPGTRGQQSAEAALAAILVGSGFTTHVDGNLVAIVRVGNDQSADDEQTQSSAEDVDTISQDIIVTGTNVRGRTSLPVPVISASREAIQSGGYATIQEYFRDLPQNNAEVSTAGAFAVGVSDVAAQNGTRSSGVNLRGLGPQATLTLLNGERRPGGLEGRSFDIGAVPLAAIDRIEVVTGGASAVYGADAIAGVVNLVTRSSLDGAESQVYYGYAPNGGSQINFSQALGHAGTNGGLIVVADNTSQDLLDATAAGRITGVPSSRGIETTRGGANLIPKNSRVSLFGKGRYELSPAVEIYADGLYSYQAFDVVTGLRIGSFRLLTRDRNISRQYSGSAGTNINFANTWRLRLTAAYGEFSFSNNSQRELPALASNSTTSKASTLTLSGVVDEGLGATQIAKRLKIGRASVYRLLAA